MPVTPTEQSGSQLTFQLRLRAQHAAAVPNSDYDLLLAAAEYIDYLSAQVVDLTTTDTRRVVFTLAGPCAHCLSRPTSFRSSDHLPTMAP